MRYTQGSRQQQQKEPERESENEHEHRSWSGARERGIVVRTQFYRAMEELYRAVLLERNAGVYQLAHLLLTEAEHVALIRRHNCNAA